MLWVGLGNPETRYAHNRHNIGFMVVEAMAEFYEFSGWKKQEAALLATGMIGGQKIRLVKPMGYMNRSGQVVGAVARYFSMEPEHITVFHDDIDLKPGTIRIKNGGGHGGHNGLRDLDQHMGKNYWRVRIGVGRPDHEAVDRWVLSDFSDFERKAWLHPLLGAIMHHAPILVDMAARDIFLTRVASAGADGTK